MCSAVLPPTIKPLDLQRFLGKGREIALIPERFQRKCGRETEAEYAAGGAGELLVRNGCISAGGSVALAIGAGRRDSRDHPQHLVKSQQLGGGW